MNEPPQHVDEQATAEHHSAWVLTGDLPCLGCQYNMRGLVGPMVQCPECGHTNDLTRPELWEATELPLGVRERQHWPATAGFVSLGVLATGGFTAGAVASSGLISPLFMIAFSFFCGAMLLWLWNCRKFVNSCTNPWWGIKIIVGVHIGTWCMLWAGGFMFYPEWDMVTTLIGKMLPTAVGVLAFWWTRQQLERGEDEAAYRLDWRKWRLPTGVAADMVPRSDRNK